MPGTRERGALAHGDVHGDRSAAAYADDDVRVVPVEFRLRDPHGLVKVFVRQSRIHYLVPMTGQEGCVHAARLRDPAMEEEYLHIGVCDLGDRRGLRPATPGPRVVPDYIGGMLATFPNR